MARRPFHEFVHHVGPFQDEWLGLDVRLAAMQPRAPGADASLMALHMTPIHDQDGFEDEPVPNAPGWTFRRAILPVRDLMEFLENVQAGHVHVDGQTFKLPDPDNGTRHFHFSIYEGRPAWGTTFLLQEDYAIHAKDGPQQDEVDRHLRDADPPWNGYQDVLDHFLHIQERPHNAFQRAHLEIAVEAGVELVEHEVKEQQIDLRFLACEGTDVAHLALGVIAVTEQGDTKRWRVKASDLDLVQEDTGFTARLPRSDGLVRVHIMATYRGYTAGNARVIVAQGAPELAPLRALECLSGDGDILENLRPQNDKDGQALERWTSMVFHCLGFQTLHIGGRKWDAADVVAHHPSRGSTILIECTVGTPDNKGKLGKLHRRRHELEEALGHDVTAVLVTFIKRDALSQASLKAADDDEISLLAQEDMDGLANLVPEMPALDTVEAFLRSRIPKKSNPAVQARRRQRLLR